MYNYRKCINPSPQKTIGNKGSCNVPLLYNFIKDEGLDDGVHDDDEN